MDVPITENLQRAFADDGIVNLSGLISAPLLDELSACFEWSIATDSTLPERRNMVFRFFGDKSYYSDHLPKTKGMYDLKPIPSAAGGYLADGDPYRPADSIRAN